MDRNELQGRLILTRQLASEDQVSRAYIAVSHNSALDLCAWLEQSQLLSPQLVYQIRSEVDAQIRSKPGSAVAAPLTPIHLNSGPISQFPSHSAAMSPVEASPHSIASSAEIMRPPSSAVQSMESSSSSARVSLSGSQALQKSKNQIGDYEIVRELSSGGMGAVYVARNLKLKTTVALKTLLAGKLAGTEAVQRFLIEAETTAKLTHPNIVRVHDVGEDEGQYFLVMDLIEGPSLKAFIEEKGRIESQSAAEWTCKLAEALDYAHKRSVLHRDIKPANIILSQGVEPMITDFGLAKDIGKAEGLTVSGQVMGTPEYMPPEQADGDVELVDRRADIYSLGATLYEMLVGEAPFHGATLANVIKAVLTTEPVPPSQRVEGIPKDLETICLKCLEKDPAQRYLTAKEVADDLRRFLNDEAILARRPGMKERWRRWQRRHRFALQTALVAVLAMGVSLGWAVAWPEYKKGKIKFARIAATEEMTLAIADWELEQGKNFNAFEQSLISKRESLPAKDKKEFSQWVEAQRALLKVRAKENRAESIMAHLSPAISESHRAWISQDFEEWTLSFSESLKLDEKAANTLYLEALLESLCWENSFLYPGAAETFPNKKLKYALSSAYRKAARSPGGERAYQLLGEVSLRSGDLRQARIIFSNLLSARDSFAKTRAQLGLAIVSIQSDDFTRADALLKSLVREHLNAVEKRRLEWNRKVVDALAGFKTLKIGKSTLLKLPWPQQVSKLVLLSEDGRSLSATNLQFKDGQLQLTSGQVLIEQFPGRAVTLKVRKVGDSYRLLVGLAHKEQGPGFALYNWNGARFQLSHDVFWARRLGAPYKKTNVESSHFGDIDGNGEVDIIFAVNPHSRLPTLIFNAFTNPVVKPFKLRSTTQTFQFYDFSGDGMDELVVGSGSWSDFKLYIYEGCAPSEFRAQPIFQQLMGCCDSSVLIPAKKGGGKELLILSRRDNMHNLPAIFGKDLSPQIPGGVWHLRYNAGINQFQTKVVLGTPGGHALGSFGALNSLTDLIAGYPRGFGVVHRSKQQRFRLFSAPDGFETSLRGLRKGGGFVWDVDGGGDKELVIVDGSRIKVYGLGLKYGARVGREEASQSFKADEDPLSVARGLIEAGQIDSAERVLTKHLSRRDLTSSKHAQLRLSYARLLSLKKDFKGARKQCLLVAAPADQWGYEALKKAATYSALGRDYRAAQEDLEQLEDLYTIAPVDRVWSDHMRLSLQHWLSYKKFLTLNKESFVTENPLGIGVDNPWAFRLTEEGLEMSSVGGHPAKLRIPIGTLFNTSFRMKMSFRVKVQDWWSNQQFGLIPSNGSKDGRFLIRLGCGGGGNMRNFNRSISANFARGREKGLVLNTTIENFGLDSMDPQSRWTYEVSFNRPSNLVTATLSLNGQSVSGERLEPWSLQSSPYELAFLSNPIGTRGQSVVVWESISLYLSKQDKTMPDPRLTQVKSPPLQLAGFQCLIGEHKKAQELLNKALSTKVLESEKRSQLLFSLGVILAKNDDLNGSRASFQSAKEVSAVCFENLWPSAFLNCDSVRTPLSQVLFAHLSMNQRARQAQAFRKRNNKDYALAAFWGLPDLNSKLHAAILLGEKKNYREAARRLLPHADKDPRIAIRTAKNLLQSRQYKAALEISDRLPKEHGQHDDYQLAREIVNRRNKQ